MSEIPSDGSFAHKTVLLEETIAALRLSPGDHAVDCTLGGGGHTKLLIDAVGSSGRVWAFDRDAEAVRAAGSSLKVHLDSGVLEIVQKPFSHISSEMAERGQTGRIRGICADIGVSSPQLDVAERGFSFVNSGPLDMRMDPSQGRTAADLVNELTRDELTSIFREYGEEPKAHFVADAIVKQRANRAFTTTTELAETVVGAIHYKTPSRTHPATRVFQALRIVVNDELGELEKMLDGAFECLAAGGRLAVISFHSLEDRILKTWMNEKAGRNLHRSIPRDLPITSAKLAEMSGISAAIIKPYPTEPGETEISRNPRARSAKLRVLEKTTHH